jgi:SnoaL-like domain
MAAQSLEDRIARIEKCATETIEKLEREIERLKAVTEIQNLMGRYEYLHMAGEHLAVIDLYAKNAPDPFVNIGVRGHWVGKDAPRRAWDNFARLGKKPGHMPIHPITTPVIEVAADGRTAKGVWIGIGFVARTDAQTREAQCFWEWDKYGVDFIKEDGLWKFWHFHIYRIFRCGWDDKWADQFASTYAPVVPIDYTDETKPDGPPVDSHPYDVTAVTPNIPQPPQPYETWDDSTTYGLPTGPKTKH